MNLADCFAKHKISSAERDIVLTRVAQLIQQGVPRVDAERQAVQALASQAQDTLAHIREQLAAQGLDLNPVDIPVAEQPVDTTNAETLLQSLSARRPTSKAAQMKDPVSEILTIDYDLALRDVPKLERNLALLATTPNMRKLTGQGSKDPVRRAAAFVDHATSNLLFLYDAMPPELRDRAKLWYDGGQRMVQAWAERYGISDMQAAAIIAVLSPQNGWFNNVTLAERVADIITGMQDYVWDEAMTDTARKISEGDERMAKAEGQRLGDLLSQPDVAARWVRVFDQTHNSRDYQGLTPEGGTAGIEMTGKGNPAMSSWMDYDSSAKAISILLDGNPVNVHYQLGVKHKVRSFYNNLFDPMSPLGFTTIDTHAVAAALLRPLSAAASEVNHNFGTQAGSAHSSHTGLWGSYPLYHEAYRRAAEARGILPREMQSITWEAVRGLFEAAKKSGLKAQADAIWMRYKKGEIEQTQAQQEILALAGGVTAPSWSKTPYNDTVARTYEGASQAAMDAMDKPEAQRIEPSIYFEVAPNPDNALLSSEWNDLPAEDKLQISSNVAQQLVPKILTEIGVAGVFEMHIGGYEGGTNPSLALTLSDPAKLVETAKLAGYVLSQKDMMVGSADAVEGLDPTGLVSITLPEGYGAKEIAELYDRLWQIEVDGVRVVGGHDTANGYMTIFNLTSKDNELIVSTSDLAVLINDRLGGEFSVIDSDGFSAFINQKEYGYGIPGQAAPTRRSSAQRRADRLQSEATDLVRAALDARRGVTYNQPEIVRGSGVSKVRAGALSVGARYGQARDGATSVLGVHYSQAPRVELSGKFYGKGIKGAEAKRLAYATDPRIKERIHFYVDTGSGVVPEPGVGGEVHAIHLDNLYDPVADPLGIKARVAASDVTDADYNNALESAYLDAGFDGYFVPEAMGDMGVAVLLGKHDAVPVQHLPELKPQTFFQSVYHASPFRFDKFTLDHIGSGEGAQAYGYGLYFAGHRPVADWYWEKFNNRLDAERTYTDDQLTAAEAAVQKLPENLRSDGQHLVDLLYDGHSIARLLRRAEKYDFGPKIEKWLEKTLKPIMGEDKKAQLYEVTIPDDHTMLDWDKPLSEQPEGVRENAQGEAKLLGDLNGEWTGADLYHALVEEHGSPQAASEYLKSIGIPGLRYLDGTSRGKGEGHHNYVVFDDAQIAIDKTYYQSADRQALLESYKKDPNVFWHGSPSGSLVGATNGIHVGTYRAAEEALNARIGIPAAGYWDGTRAYGETLLAGKKRMKEMGEYPTGFNVNAPEEDYYPGDAKSRAKYSGGQEVDFTSRPVISPVKIVGEMSNHRGKPMADFKANAQMSAMKTRGTAKRGYFYTNDGEDAGSISAVVPSREHLTEIILPDSGQTLNQGKDEARGYITFGPRYVIGLFKGKADLSSLLHESGHLFVKSLEEMVATGKASSQLTADLETLKKFAGDFNSVEGQEKLARGFEAYLMEGRAPTEELKSAFRSFKRWLLWIYKDVRNLDVELNDDVRGVFDRMMGAERDATETQEFYSSSQVEDAMGAHLSDAEKAKLMAVRGNSKEATVEKQTARLLAAWRKAMGGKAALEAEARDLVKRQPVYQALDRAAMEGGMNRQELVELVGEEQVQALRKKRVGLVVNEGGVDMEVLSVATGYMSVDEMIADMTTAPTQADAVKTMVEERLAQKEAEILAELNDEQVSAADDAYHSDATLSAIMLEFRALQRLASEKGTAQAEVKDKAKQADKLQKKVDLAEGQIDELKRQKEEARQAALADKAAKAESNKDQLGLLEARDIAKGILARMPLGEALFYRVFAAAERKAAREALRFAKAADWMNAAEAKRREMLNHALVLESLDLQREVTKNLGAIRRFVKSKKMEAEHREQILALVEKHALGTKSMAPVNRDQLLPLTDFLAQAFGEEDRLFNPKDFYDETLLGLPPTEYKKLGTEQFRELMHLIRDLAEHGSPAEFARLLTEEGRPPMQHEIEKLLTQINKSGNKAPLYDENTWRDKMTGWERDIFAHLNMRLDMLRRADGFLGPDKTGPWMRWGQKLTDGLRRKARMMREVLDVKAETDLARLRYESRFKKKFGSRVAVLNGVAVPDSMKSVGRYTWTAEHIWCLARNMGNEGNLRYITEGLGLSLAQVQKLTSILTEGEWRAIEKEMGLIGRNYTESAQVFKLIYNRVMPERVVPVPFDAITADGQTIRMPGWYYPFSVDRKLSKDLAGKQDQDVLKQSPNITSFRPDVQKSFTKGRKGGARPTSLTYGVFEKGIYDQIQFITMAAVTKDLDTLMHTIPLRDAWEAAFGEADYKETLVWIKNNYNPVTNDDNQFDGTLNQLRAAGVIYALAANAKSAARQYNGFFSAAKHLGSPVWVIKGIAAMMKGKASAILEGRVGSNVAQDLVNKMDPLMEERDRGGFNTEQKDLNRKLGGSKIKVTIGDKIYTRRDVVEFAMGLTHAADAHVTYAVWMGAYMKATTPVAEGGLGKDAVAAVRYAYEAVEASQVTTDDTARNQWQRDPKGWQKVFGTFMSEAFRKGSRMRMDFASWRTGNKSLYQYGRDCFYDILMPSLYNVAIISLMGSVAPDDWEDYFWGIWGELFGVIPLGNIPAGIAQYGSRPGQTPAMTALEKTIDPPMDLWQLAQKGGDKKKKQEALLKSVIDLTALGLGIGNVRKLYTDAARGWKDMERGRTHNPLRMLFPEPKDKQKK